MQRVAGSVGSSVPIWVCADLVLRPVYFSSALHILYKITVLWRSSMEINEWVARCSARLHAQWPRLQREQRDEVARDLWNDQRWQHSEPEVAAVEWLSQGIPVPVGSEQ